MKHPHQDLLDKLHALPMNKITLRDFILWSCLTEEDDINDRPK